MTYQAVVAKIDSIERIEWADRIVKATVLWTICIVGIDFKVGDYWVLFWTDGKLDEEFASKNSLFKHQGWYLEANGRIRSLKLKKVKSEGLFMPLHSFSYIDKAQQFLTLWTLFDEVNGKKICEKYVSPETIRAMNAMLNGRRVKRWETEMFKKHFDTEQIRYYWREIKKWDRLIITEKLHGTSQRYGHVQDIVAKKRWQKLFKITPAKKWVEMAGTRNVIITDGNKETWFHSAAFRDGACEPFVGKLHKWEVVYYEVVGFEGEATPIMWAVSVKELDKDTQELYQNNIGIKQSHGLIYSYGCNPGQYEVYVYRITIANEDWHTVDYSWEDVKKRCAQLGVKYVPELLVVPAFGGSYKVLEKKLEKLLPDGPSTIDKTHPCEWYCLRVESWLSPKIYKRKLWTFGFLEGIFKDSGTPDTEEAS